MKKYFKHPSIYILALLPLFASLSCTKDIDVPEPEFDVVANKTKVAVNEPITFNFTGSADLISFYSGEKGKEYRFRERSKVDGKPQMKFNSLRQYGLNTTAVDQTLKVLVSTDFKGIYDLPTITSATWTDISTRGTLSNGPATATVFVPSGNIDLSDLYTPGVPFYLAFRYENATGVQSQRTWTINSLAIDSKLPDGSLVSVATVADLTWGSVNVSGAQVWTFNATQIQMAGGTGANPTNEDWLITKPLLLDNVQRDYGVNVKGNPIVKPTSYEYIFKTPGTYTVTFEAINANKWDQKTIIKEFTITVQ